jgi:hypothetical protein
MPHNEFQSVSRVRENLKHGLTGRDWKSVYDLVNKSLRNRKGGATGYQVYEIRRQSFTLLAVLAQILANALKQLIELEKMVESGRDTLGLLRDINRGINDSLAVIDSLAPYIDPGLYKELKNVAAIAQHLQSSYGSIVDSPEAQVQTDTDEVVAEGVSMNNSLYNYAAQIDKIGEEIKQYSHEVSPGGAQKLTAQSLGVIVHVMNQQLRATATGLKLQAQAMAVQNRKEKTETTEYLNQMQTLEKAMQKSDVKFEFPRF